MATTGRQIGEFLRIGRTQIRLVPVIAANFVVLGDVQLSFVERESVRLVQPAENGCHPFGFARVFGVGKRYHLALTRFADQQHAARGEDHHARAVDFFGKN